MSGEEKQLRAIVRLLSLQLSGTLEMDSDELLAFAYDSDGDTVETDQDTPAEEMQKQVDIVYSLYPGKCPNRGISTGKSSKDKERIKRLIKKIGYAAVVKGTKTYVSDCKENGCYMKNFATFLNNFPDEEDEAPALNLTGDDYYK